MPEAIGRNIVVIQTTKGITMNLYIIVYNFIRILSILSIFIILSLGFILPISLIHGLVINPIILVSLMVCFAISHKKLQSIKQSADIVRLPDNSKFRLSNERNVA